MCAVELYPPMVHTKYDLVPSSYLRNYGSGTGKERSQLLPRGKSEKDEPGRQYQRLSNQISASKGIKEVLMSKE